MSEATIAGRLGVADETIAKAIASGAEVRTGASRPALSARSDRSGPCRAGTSGGRRPPRASTAKAKHTTVIFGAKDDDGRSQINSEVVEKRVPRRLTVAEPEPVTDAHILTIQPRRGAESPPPGDRSRAAAMTCGIPPRNVRYAPPAEPSRNHS